MQNTDLTKKEGIIKHKNLLSHVKMSEKNLMFFWDIEIKIKKTFYRYKSPFF